MTSPEGARSKPNPLLRMFEKRFGRVNQRSLDEAMREAITPITEQKPAYQAITSLIERGLIDPQSAMLDFTLLHWRGQDRFKKEIRARTLPTL